MPRRVPRGKPRRERTTHAAPTHFYLKPPPAGRSPRLAPPIGGLAQCPPAHLAHDASLAHVMFALRPLNMIAIRPSRNLGLLHADRCVVRSNSASRALAELRLRSCGFRFGPIGRGSLRRMPPGLGEWIFRQDSSKSSLASHVHPTHARYLYGHRRAIAVLLHVGHVTLTRVRRHTPPWPTLAPFACWRDFAQSEPGYGNTMF